MTFRNPRKSFFRMFAGDEEIPTLDHVFRAGQGNSSDLGDNLFMSMHYVETTRYGGGTVEIEVHDKVGDRLERIIFNNKSNFSFQFGVVGIPGRQSPRLRMAVLDINPTFVPFGGVTLKFSGIDEGVAGLNGTPKTRAWKPNMLEGGRLSVSGIVKKIAQENGLQHAVEDTTTIPFLNEVIQTQKTDYSFIQDCLLPVASAFGSNDFNFWLSTDTNGNSVLNFRQAKRDDTIRKTYIFGRSIHSEVEQFQPKFNRYMTFLFGGTGLTLNQPPDPLKSPTGQSVQTRSDESSNEPQLGKKTVERTLSNSRDNQGRIINTRINTTARKGSSAQADVSGKQTSAASIIVEAQMQILGDPSVHPLDLINLIQIKSGNRNSGSVITNADLAPTSGVYLIRQVTHDISQDGVFRTNLDLYREGNFTGPVSLPGLVKSPALRGEKPSGTRTRVPLSLEPR